MTLNNPSQRNALNLEMFDALQSALSRVSLNPEVHILKLTGAGPVFCSGFDLRAAADDPALVAQYIQQLSHTNRLIRRLPQIVIAVVQGAALAGGCALLGACDFIYTEPNAKLGYPVHRLGISPAVTMPTLRNRMIPGQHRAFLLSDRIIDGRAALKIGLVTHVADSSESLPIEAQQFAQKLAHKGPHAMRITKDWLNQLDGSLDDKPFNDTVDGSAHLATQEEALTRLHQFWQDRK